MAPVKQSARKPAKKITKRTATKQAVKKTTAKKAVKRPGPRKMTAAHKRALAEGRTLSATVEKYLAAVNAPKRRGRKVSRATMEQRLVAARAQVRTATGVEKVLAAQQVRDLQRKLAESSASSPADVKQLESDFVKVAKRFSEARGISWGSWRDAGVSADVLKRAGVTRTRG